MVQVQRVNTLKTEGKSYDIFYKKRLALNITLERGREMTRALAVNILVDMLRQHKILTDIRATDVTFTETEPAL